MTAHGTIPDAVEATHSGVASYLTKPFDSDALVTQIQLTLIGSGFNGKNNSSPTTDNNSWRRQIISKSQVMETLLDQIDRLASSNALIILQGEPGTGKDELARALHARSHRSEGPLVHLSCTSLAAERLELEMFGQVGDRTGNNPERLGLLRQAHGGTLLISNLDEVDSRFLHRVLLALDHGTAYPVDSDTSYRFDVRGVWTTDVVGGYGREHGKLWDLGSKLGATFLTVPSLRERPEDVPHITTHILSELEDRSIQFSNKAMQAMLAAQWPGNVRQLTALVKQCVSLSKTKIVSDALVSGRLSNRALQVQPISNAHRDFERDYLTEVLKITNGERNEGRQYRKAKPYRVSSVAE